MCPPAPMSELTGFGPCPTQLASSAVRGCAEWTVEPLEVEVVVVLAALRPPLEQAPISRAAQSAAAIDRPRNLPNGLLDLSGLEARGADVHALRRAVHDRPDSLDVR